MNADADEGSIILKLVFVEKVRLNEPFCCLKSCEEKPQYYLYMSVSVTTFALQQKFLFFSLSPSHRSG